MPLVEQDSANWQERVDPYLNQIEQYELRRSFRRGPSRSNARRSAPASEPERFLGLARSYYEAGDVTRAEQTLTALSQVLKGDSKFENIQKLADELLTEIRTRQSPSDEFLKDAMTRAQKLFDEGKKREAKEIWQSIVKLYENDPYAPSDVDDARKKLNEEKTAGP
jgi:serine/threonine-protein kinase